MQKVDFDILLTPSASTSNLKDISLVQGLASVAQQIKSVVSMSAKEIPFSSVVGANVQDYISKNRLYDIFLNESINSSVAYAVKDIFNLSSAISISENNPGIVKIIIKFDYKTRTTQSSNNTVTVEVTTTI
jgi:hypothetical protein